jgi:hypothetical protein
MSPRQVGTHRQTQVHRTGGSGEMPRVTRLALGLRKYPRVCHSRWHGLEKVEHHWYLGSLVHPLGMGASGVLAQFSHPEDSRAWPPLGTHR